MRGKGWLAQTSRELGFKVPIKASSRRSRLPGLVSRLPREPLGEHDRVGRLLVAWRDQQIDRCYEHLVGVGLSESRSKLGMKQVFRRVIDPRGRVLVSELPVPHVGPDQLLVQSQYSLISSGTEMGTLSKTPAELVKQTVSDPWMRHVVKQTVLATGPARPLVGSGTR